MSYSPISARRCAVPVLALLALVASGNSNAADSRMNSMFGQVPMAFEKNVGQTDESVRFMSRGPGYNVFLTDRETVVSLARTTSTGAPAVVRWRYVEANADTTMQGVSQRATAVNYLRGKDAGDWLRGVKTYSKVRQQNIYQGIDVVYYGKQDRLEYDFVVEPGADPSQIRMAIAGTDRLTVAENGDLVMSVGGDELRQKAPVVYQDVAGARQPVKGQFVVANNTEVGFRIGEYDTDRPLVIDPVIVYSTYLGGSGADHAGAIAVDSSGYVYVAGHAQSVDFPVTPGAYQPSVGNNGPGQGDSFVAKFDPDGSSLVYSTYLGGSGHDEATSLVVDEQGNVYLTGMTDSLDFPVTSGAFAESPNEGAMAHNAFVTKLLSSGAELGFSTYLGGSAEDYANDIALGPSGNVFVVGETISRDYPVSGTAFQNEAVTRVGADTGFVTKLAADGSALVYSTYFSGESNSFINAVTVDINGNAHFVGYTHSEEIPLSDNAYQTTRPNSAFPGNAMGFVAKLNGDGSYFIYSSFLGGSGGDFPMDIVLHHDETVYVSGLTSSYNYPVTPGAVQPVRMPSDNEYNYDPVVTRFNVQGDGLVFSTYFGGSGNDGAYGLGVDEAGNSIFGGYTASSDFPVTADAFQREHAEPDSAGGRDGFIAKLNSTGSLALYSTYVGSSSHDFVNDVSVGESGDAYLAGTTSGKDFPTSSGAYQPQNAGSSDAFVMQLTDGVPLPALP